MKVLVFTSAYSKRAYMMRQCILNGMNQTYKEIITKINSKIYNIKNRRENIHLEWNETYVEDLSVPAGLYKRSVIIATNVAEASVTIPGLAFVIDN